MARQRHIRASFVVTFAVTAASACGGGVASDDGSGGAGGSGGNPPACPSSVPPDGGSCSKVGMKCTYENSLYSCGNDLKQEATCTPNGTWQVSWHQAGTSCNPPPPPEDCPSKEPSAGVWCNVEPELVCSYSGGCCARMYECQDHVWAETTPPCNPPIPICPEAPPDPGSACDNPCDLVYSCDYGTCGDDAGGAISASCEGGAWVVSAVDCG